MLFNSFSYLLLLAATGLVMAVSRWRAWFLLIASLSFYAFAGIFDLSVFLAALAVNWLVFAGLAGRRGYVAAAVLFNIGLLAWFKYAAFVTGDTMSTMETALPLGISFYTFQILSYHVDVARGISAGARDFPRFALFKAFFPQLIAGPIVRSSQLLPQVDRLFSGHRRKVRLVSWGLALFTLGLFKKIVIADAAAPHVDEIFALGPENALWAWLGATLFAFQIYADFSGYSDMALGSAFLLGIRLPVNFRTPYLSLGPRAFWQRWHITLSSWIRDYLYIPLGGNRGGAIRNALVVVGVMAIAGLWHGANLTFVAWGACWGVYIYLARILSRHARPPAIVAWPLHMAATVVLWVLFRSPDMAHALHYIGVMAGLEQGAAAPGNFHRDSGMLVPLLLFVLALFGLHGAEAALGRRKTLYVLKKWDGPFLYGLFGAVWICLLLLQPQDAQPFIYFRF